MGKTISSSEIPAGSIIADGFGKCDYIDSYMTRRATDASVDRIATDIFRVSGVGAVLMKIRDVVVRPFGLHRPEDEASEMDHYPPGSKVGMFPVLTRNENEIVMGADDKHLYFRTSVFIDRAKSEIHLTTIVQYHNFGGRLYFTLIKPFHRMLVGSSFKKIQSP